MTLDSKNEAGERSTKSLESWVVGRTGTSSTSQPRDRWVRDS